MFSRYLDRNNLKNLTAGVFSTLARLMHLYVGMIYTSCCKERTIHPISEYQLPWSVFLAVLLPMTAFNLGSYTFSLIFLTLQMHFSLFRFSWSVLQYILFQFVFHQGWDEFKRRILKRIFKSNGVSSWNPLDFFLKETKWQEIQIFTFFEEIEQLLFY